MTVFTLFPQWFDGPLGESILGRAQQAGALSIRVVNFRDYATDRHATVDDAPYGGGGGIILRADVLAAAMDATIGAPGSATRPHVILTSARGKIFDQQKAIELAQRGNLAFVCGHYEGVDERLIETRVDEEISLGEFVLTGGELPAMTMIDAIARMIPGVLGNAASAPNDSYMNGLLEGAHYTRPEIFEGRRIPDVLKSGNHAEIERWREHDALARTKVHRPDLWEAQLLHPDQVRRIARRRRPFALWRGQRDFAQETSTLLYASPSVLALDGWRGLLRGNRCEKGMVEGVWFREIREAAEGDLRQEVAEALAARRHPAARRMLENLLREMDALATPKAKKLGNSPNTTATDTGESA
ncbi:MAG TPA: tRNA (guanosine(37)-N1)-methyltransferase TrmD [Candidatus Sumerlaeota bacterium]|nr:tRNA (guanosine(37)-N1)-methyltransferase TrmD [Candidatus Sumerlaeota bacterium]